MPEYRSQIVIENTDASCKSVAAVIGLLILGYLLTAMVINRSITHDYWQPYLEGYTEKLAATAELRESISTIFVGSSHLVTGIHPAVFDTEISTGQSFNLGVFGALAPVQKNSLVYIQQQQMPNLQYVFFEPMLYDVPITPALSDAYENLFSTRNRYFYDLDTSLRLIRLRVSADRSLINKIFGVGAIAAAWLIHESNFGVVPDILHERPTDASIYETVLNRRGYGILSSRPHLFEISSTPDINEGYRNISANELELLNSFINLIRAAGAEPVFIFPPSRKNLGKQRAIRDAVKQHLPDIAVMDYSFDKNPIDLYSNKRMWADEDHLSLKGAKDFSKILAKDWRTRLEAEVANQP